MSSNNDSCCTGGPIDTGTTTNGTIWVVGYDPNMPVPYWHQRMELATICVCNSLTLIVIVSRLWYRCYKFKRFRGDDWWIAVAGFFLLPYWACQIGTNIYGSGLHEANLADNYDLEMHWQFELGWCGYYIVASCIKISVCVCFLGILPHHIRKLRYATHALCGLIALLGTAITLAWIFQCTPFLSNFLWSVSPESCVNYDIFRWMWIGLSIPIDIVLLIIPARILKKVQLREHERRILKLVFSATLLGTITCAIGIYGIYETRTGAQADGTYQETAFIMMNDIEIFMYALGASLPVLSRYIVNQAARRSNRSSRVTGFSTIARRFPNFFVSSNRQSTRDNDTRDMRQLHSNPSDTPQDPLSQLKSAFDDMAPLPDTLHEISEKDLESGKAFTSVKTSRASSDDTY